MRERGRVLNQRVIRGDNREWLRAQPDESVDCFISDPPYGIRLMGKHWDSDIPDVETLAEMWRCAKPGANMALFGSPATFWLLALNAMIAGWRLRDTLCWLHGEGMPKGPSPQREGMDGRATCLKPAWETVLWFQKPFKGTVLANLAKHGTGAIRVDDCRVPVELDDFRKLAANVENIRKKGGVRGGSWSNDSDLSGANPANPLGRYPTNVLLDALAARAIDEQAGERPGMSGGGQKPADRRGTNTNTVPLREPVRCEQIRGDSGGASRFLYVPKAKKGEKSSGVEGGNNHPSVKPLDVMRWLVRLLSEPTHTVVDPWAGSGTTGVACAKEGRSFVGIELDDDAMLDGSRSRYVEIANQRIAAVSQ